MTIIRFCQCEHLSTAPIQFFFGENIPGKTHIRLNPVHHKELALAGQYQPGRMRDWMLVMMLVIGLPFIQSRATISDNGYKGVVIAISPEEAEDLVLVESLKELFTSASRELFGASISQRNKFSGHVAKCCFCMQIELVQAGATIMPKIGMIFVFKRLSSDNIFAVRTAFHSRCSFQTAQLLLSKPIYNNTMQPSAKLELYIIIAQKDALVEIMIG